MTEKIGKTLDNSRVIPQSQFNRSTVVNWKEIFNAFIHTFILT